jgi:hypothetical protein
MNPRRVHELMREHFPAIEAHLHEWQIVSDGKSLRREELTRLIRSVIDADEMLVEIDRFSGDFTSLKGVLNLVSERRSAPIKIADRQFKGLVFIAPGGTATAWRTATGV